jgi:hypothetical protein
VTSLGVIVFMTFVCFKWACFKSILSVSVHVTCTIRRNVPVPEMVLGGMSLQCARVFVCVWPPILQDGFANGFPRLVSGWFII